MYICLKVELMENIQLQFCKSFNLSADFLQIYLNYKIPTIFTLGIL